MILGKSEENHPSQPTESTIEIWILLNYHKEWESSSELDDFLLYLYLHHLFNSSNFTTFIPYNFHVWTHKEEN